MIITQLIGGLGNQMFQYAAGLSLARETGMEFRIDTTALKKYKLHQGYQLDKIFQGVFPQATEWEMLKVLGLRKYRVVRRGAEIRPEYRLAPGYPWIRQPKHDYWSDFERINYAAYLSGYWQSSKYFLSAEPAIREAFSFKENLNGKNFAVKESMKSEESVAVHIRRGDYAIKKDSADPSRFCDWSYYEAGIEKIHSVVKNPVFYVFSDEPEIARAQFHKSQNFHIIDWNADFFSYRDLHLMSLCKHHIIANSTFSWWGAWLAKHQDQIVVAPTPWFKGSVEQISDIYEPDWIRL